MHQSFTVAFSSNLVRVNKSCAQRETLGLYVGGLVSLYYSCFVVRYTLSHCIFTSYSTHYPGELRDKQHDALQQ